MNGITSNLIKLIRYDYDPEEKLKTSKDGRQTIFFRKGGKSLCYIETQNGKSVVTVVIGASLNDKVQSANISHKAKKMFAQAKQFHDGKWLFFEVRTNGDLEDIKSLLAIKRSPVKK